MAADASFDNPKIPHQPNPTVFVSLKKSITPTDFNAKWKDEGDDVTIYTNYSVRNQIEKDYHRYMGGVTSPGGFQGNSVAFFQLANPTVLWFSHWSASRWKTQPKIPNPDSKNPNWVLLDEHLGTMNLTYAMDGQTPIYRIGGLYVYGSKNPNVRTTADLQFAFPPWLDGSPETNVTETSLQQGIINPKTGATGNIIQRPPSSPINPLS